MKTPKIVKAFTIAIVAIVFVTMVYALYNPVGHFIRRIQGETGAQQTVNSLADSLRGQAILDQVQQWSMQLITRFDAGGITTNSAGPNWPIHAVVIGSNEIPSFVRNLRPSEEPEVAIGLSTNSRAECVIIDWYLSGLVLGPTNQGQSLFNLYDDYANKPIIPLYGVCVRPGAFAIWYDSK